MSDGSITESKFPERDKRWQRILDCVALKQPDRMPVGFYSLFWLAKYGNISFKELMYDYDKAHEIALRACEEFQPDSFDCHLIMGIGQMLERSDFKQLEWPGHGVDVNRPYQYLDKEYMFATEYDDFLLDPTGFYLEKYLPRVVGAYDGLQPLSGLAGELYVGLSYASAMFTLPGVQTAFERLKQSGEEAMRAIQKEVAFAERLAKAGFPINFGGVALAPYDFIADFFRGATGMMKDTFRYKEKLHEVLDKVCALQLKRILSRPGMNGSNMVFFPIHWAPDAFMSQKTFETFYWPSLRKLMIGLIDAGRIPWVLWEHDCTKRWETIKDIPAGKCVYWFEQGDLVKAWEVMGDVVALKGNVKTTTMSMGTPEMVDAEVKHLVDNIWNKGGSLILETAFAIPDEAPIENVRAYFNAARKYAG